MIEAGWYPNPLDPTTVRYWDGENWTEHTAPYPQASPQEETPETFEKETPTRTTPHSNKPEPEPEPEPTTPKEPILIDTSAEQEPVPIPVPMPTLPSPTVAPYTQASSHNSETVNIKQALVIGGAIFGVLILLVLALFFAVKTFTSDNTPQANPFPPLTSPLTPDPTTSSLYPEEPTTPSSENTSVAALATWIEQTKNTTGEYPTYDTPPPTEIEASLPTSSSLQICYTEDLTAYAIYLAETNTDYIQTISEYLSTSPNDIRVITTDGSSPFCGQIPAEEYPRYGPYFYGTAPVTEETLNDAPGNSTPETAGNSSYDNSAGNKAAAACYELNTSSTTVAGAGTGIPFGIGAAEEAYISDPKMFEDFYLTFSDLNNALNSNDVNRINSTFAELTSMCTAYIISGLPATPLYYNDLLAVYQSTWNELSSPEVAEICSAYISNPDATLNILGETYEILPALPTSADYMTRRVGLTVFLQTNCPVEEGVEASDLLTEANPI